MTRDLEGRCYLVTGTNTGIGRVTALELARRGARVFHANRSEERTRPVLDDIRRQAGERSAEFLPLDLADLASVRACAQRFLDTGEPLHGLINNAGLAGLRGLTQDGFEMAFGVNHLGHFLLTRLLLEHLKASAPARIVNVSSRAHLMPKRLDFDAVRLRTRTRTGQLEYGVSKLCNVLFTTELARRLEGSGVTAYALHPGVIASDIWRRVPWPLRPLITRFMATPEQGAQTTLYCATSPDVATHSGRYYDACAERTPGRLARDAALARELWERSEEWTRPGAS